MDSDHAPSRNLLRQLVISLVASFSTVSSGMSLGFSAIALPELQNSTSADHLTIDQASWFASIASIATPIGCLLCGPCLDRFGRRNTLLAVNVPFLLGWITLSLVPQPASTPLLYLGRMLTGLGTGIASIPSCVYIGEVSDRALRGMLVTWPSIGISTGILIVYVFGTLYQENWRMVALLCALFPFITAISTLLVVKESPLWLISRGRDKEAEASLKWLYNINTKETPESVETELRTMSQNVRKQEQVGSDGLEVADTDKKRGVEETLSLLTLPQAWKPLFIMNGYFFFQQFSGIYVVVFYAVDIVLQAGVTIDEYLGTVLLGVVQLVAGIAVSYALTRCGRRPMSLLSGVGMIVSMIGLAVYLQLVPNGSEVARNNQHLSVIPLIMLLLYVIAGAIGFHTLPWAMVGEMYPPLIRGVAGGLTTFMAYLFNFAALKMYPFLLNLFGGDVLNPKTSSSEGVFYFYGVVSVVATVFVLLYLTETHRKTLQEIEQEFVTKPVLRPSSQWWRE